jgi:hypothetical protein
MTLKHRLALIWLFNAIYINTLDIGSETVSGIIGISAMVILAVGCFLLLSD